MLLVESNLRRKMTQLYRTVWVEDNAKIISKLEPSTLADSYQFSGPKGERAAANELIRWLDNIREFSKSDEVFSNQMLDPIKEVARFRITAMHLGKNVSSNGWVFAKSQPYSNDYYSETITRVTLSVMFPQFQTMMSIRVAEDFADTIEYGMYNFGDILPFPLTNRIRQSKPKAEKVSYQPDFSKYDFLFASLVDLEQFACSLEMRHYSEISSPQSQKKALMGALLFVPGKITSVNFPMVYVQSILKPSLEIPFLVDVGQAEKKLLPARIEDCKGKTVRLAVVRWYDSEEEEEGYPEYHEILSLQEESDVSQLALDEIAGYVRIRGEAHVNEIMSEFNRSVCQNIPLLQNSGQPVQGGILQNVNGTISYNQRTLSAQPIISEFLASMDKIRNLRFGQSGSRKRLVTPEDMLDKEKISVKNFARSPIFDAHALVVMKLTMDESGTKNVREVPVTGDKARKMWFWRTFGILDEHHRTKGDYVISKIGEDVAYERVRKEIDAAVSTSGEIVSLPQLAKEHPLIPPSFIVRFLKEEEMTGNAKESSENIFWFRPATAANADNICKMRVKAYQYINSARYIMSQVWHDYPRHGIMEILFKEKHGYGVFVSKRLCTLVEKLGKVKVMEVNSEITWHFPLDQRILYLFRQNSTAALTIEQIIERIVVPHSTRIISLSPAEENELVTKALESLRRKNCVKESNGKWIFSQK
jgi:hypothetical protein